MDFQSLLRRDLQFLCKKNKIPANMTNVAMADALKALEIVEGLEEYMNQFEKSPVSVAKQPSKTATRTTRRTTTVKAEPKPSSRLVSHSTSKSLAEEMDQENVNKTVAQEPKTNSVKFETNVPKTPGARSTRKASAATSCAKKDELVQSVYSTRRSTRLLEKCMADLSLKTGETLDKAEQNEDTEQKVSAQENNQAGSETEVIPGRNLSDSMEQWENLKNDSDQIVEDLEVDVDDIAVMNTETERKKEEINEVTTDEKESENSLVHKDDDQEETMVDQTDSDAGDSETKIDEDNQTSNDADIADIAVMNTNTERDMEEMIEVKADEEASENSVVQADAQEEPLQANNEESLKKNDSDDSPLLEYANIETHSDLALDNLVQVNEQETEQANKEDDSELDTMVDQTDSDDGDTETEPEEDNYGNDSDDTISETDSNQADQIVEDHEVHVDIAVMDTNTEENKEEMNEVTTDAKESENGLVQKVELLAEKNDNADSRLLEYVYTETHNDLVMDSLVQVEEQEPEQAVQENDSQFEKINVEETMVDQTNTDATDSETEKAIQQNDSVPEKTEPEEEEEDNSGDDDSEDTISEADSNQAVLGSDIAVDEEMTLYESEGSNATTNAPKSPPHLEVAKDTKTTDEVMTLSESDGSTATTEVVKDIKTSPAISYQFPRPTKSTTTPLKNSSAMKVVNENKENNMEMMMNENGVKEGKMMEKKKKVTKIDEENLKDMSMRQLEKMLKELSIKNNRTALKILPGTNNQTAE